MHKQNHGLQLNGLWPQYVFVLYSQGRPANMLMGHLLFQIKIIIIKRFHRLYTALAGLQLFQSLGQSSRNPNSCNPTKSVHNFLKPF